MLIVWACIAAPGLAQDKEKADEGPTNEKAQKAYKEGLDDLHHRQTSFALDSFKKADKQDGGHCLACQKKMIKYGLELHEWKTAQAAAEEMIAQAHAPRDAAMAHYLMASILTNEGMDRHKDELFTRAHEEMLKALASAANFPMAIYADGLVLAHLKQDEAAKARFEEFVKMHPEDDPDRQACFALYQPT
jgi:outer membrane protein assembly factor BamD (BamD/ComL family)